MLEKQLIDELTGNDSRSPRHTIKVRRGVDFARNGSDVFEDAQLAARSEHRD